MEENVPHDDIIRWCFVLKTWRQEIRHLANFKTHYTSPTYRTGKDNKIEAKRCHNQGQFDLALLRGCIWYIGIIQGKQKASMKRKTWRTHLSLAWLSRLLTVAIGDPGRKVGWWNGKVWFHPVDKQQTVDRQLCCVWNRSDWIIRKTAEDKATGSGTRRADRLYTGKWSTKILRQNPSQQSLNQPRKEKLYETLWKIIWN